MADQTKKESKTAGQKDPDITTGAPKSSAKILLDIIHSCGVEHCWGYPGGAILPLYDVMYDADIEHLLVRHEQGAAFAAEGYARATGRLGVVFATSGPGATNLITGIADAKMDSAPTLFVTGQVASKDIGTDAFQEADIYGMSMPITKYNALIKNPDDTARITREAITVAMARRQGPTLIDFPKDIQVATSEVHDEKRLSIPEFHYVNPPIKGDLDELIRELNASHRPLLYIGGGAVSSGATQLIRELAEKGSIPVTSTLMGLGAFPGEHDLFLGMLGMHGTAYANKAVMNCDLIISLGARFDDRVAGDADQFAHQARRVQIDIDGAEIQKRVQADLTIQGHLEEVLPLILKGLDRKDTGWLAEIAELKKNHPLRFNRVEGKIKPQYMVHRISERTEGKAVVVTDVGQHQMWAAQFYTVNEPRNWISSGGLGTMGFGLPAAIGAKKGRPDDEVILFTGDGSIQMNIQELATARMYDIKVKIVLFHNGFLGMVRQWQELFFQERYSHSVLVNDNPDFCAIAKAYGVPAKKISTSDEIEEGIDFLLNTDDVCLLEVMIPEKEMVYPMIPAGKKYEEMIEFDPASEEGEVFEIVPHKSRGGKS